MEESRLKPMAVGYDERLFNRIYSDTEALRRKLAGQIDSRRFGLTYEDILSWFDVKFVFCFNKHHDDPPEKLKAFLINSLQRFRYRIMRAAYTKKYSQNIVSFEALVEEENDLLIDTSEEKSYYLDKVMEFMKKHLSDNALLLLEVQLNPPPFILLKLNQDKDKPLLQKIPDEVLLEYLDLGNSDRAYNYLYRLKKEIKEATKYAKHALN